MSKRILQLFPKSSLPLPRWTALMTGLAFSLKDALERHSHAGWAAALNAQKQMRLRGHLSVVGPAFLALHFQQIVQTDHDRIRQQNILESRTRPWNRRPRVPASGLSLGANGIPIDAILSNGGDLTPAYLQTCILDHIGT